MRQNMHIPLDAIQIMMAIIDSTLQNNDLYSQDEWTYQFNA